METGQNVFLENARRREKGCFHSLFYEFETVKDDRLFCWECMEYFCWDCEKVESEAPICWICEEHLHDCSCKNGVILIDEHGVVIPA